MASRKLQPVTDFIKNESVSKIKQRHGEADQYIKEWHSNIDRWRNLYDFRHYKGRAAPGESRFPDPTPTNVVDLAVGVFIRNDIAFSAKGWSQDIEEAEVSDQIEKYLLGTIERSIEREQYDIQFDVTHKFVRDGAAVMYTVWDPVLDFTNRTMTEIIDLQSPTGVRQLKAYKETPVRVQSIDPKKISMLPGGPRRWLHFFRTEEKTVYDVETEYNVKLAKYNHRSMFDKMDITGEFVDYWRIAVVGLPKVDGDGEEIINRVTGEPEMEEGLVVINAILFEDVFIKEPEVMPGYTDIPYTVGLFKPIDRDDPSKWHSILRPIESSIKFLEYAVNRRMKQIDVYSGLPMIVKSAPGRDIQIEPGWSNVKKISIEEDIAFPQWPGNAPDVERHIGYLRSRLQQAGFSDVMYGLGSRGGGETAQFAIQQLADQNRIRLEQPSRQLAMMWTIWARKVLDMTGKFAVNSAVRVYGRQNSEVFSEQVIGGEIADFLVKAQVQPEMPGESVRKHAMATQVGDDISHRTKLERYYDIEQPLEEIKRMIVDRAIMHPGMQLYGMIRQLMKKANEGDRAAALTLQQIQGGALANVGQGQQRPNPTQTVGGGGSNPPQASGGAPPGQSVQEDQERQARRAPNLRGGV